MKNIKSLIAGLSLVVGLGVGSISAFAEGHFTSYLQGVRAGFATRNWDDGNYDDHHTTWTQSPCDAQTMTVTLRRNRGLWPSASLGDKTIPCSSYGPKTVDWGRVESGSYFIYLDKVNGSKSRDKAVTVSSVTVRY